MHSSPTQILLDNLLERLNYYRTEEAITFYAPYKFDLKQRIKQLEKHILKLRTNITENPNENIEVEELQSLYSLMSKESFSQEFIERSKNVISNSTINVGGNFHIGDIIHSTKTKGLSILLFVVFVTVIGFWQKEEIKIALGFDKFFVEDDQDFKIIILPFNEICKDNGKNYDAGFVIKERLNGIIQKDSLKVKTHYWENIDLENFNDQKADELRKYHNADMILYGTYQTGSCSAEGDQICLNYLTDEKWKLGKTGYDLDKLNYKQGGLDALKKGKISEKVESIAVFVSVLAQMKNIDHSKYLAKLREVLEEHSTDKSTQTYVYEEIAKLLLEDKKIDEALINYQKASLGFKSNKKIFEYVEILGMIGEIFLHKKQIDSANFYHDKGKKLLWRFLRLYKNRTEKLSELEGQALHLRAKNFLLISDIMKAVNQTKELNFFSNLIQQKTYQLDSQNIKEPEKMDTTYYFVTRYDNTQNYYNKLSTMINEFLCDKTHEEMYCEPDKLIDPEMY
ncbi:hypothetical protein ACE193_08825 [Bernardetia sp. OM2101]|uniref:hypothetical protein n=1 Tax=Bernardetia sp. OM2101 TaxID=3344876 RepID=UPI0035CFBB76